MGYALVAHASQHTATGTGGGTTAAVDTTGANLLVAVLAYDSGATPITVSDSNGNTWVPLTNHSGTVASRVNIWYAKSATCGAGHTFTMGGPNFTTFGSFSVAAFSGGDTTAPFDVDTGSNEASGATLATGSITPGVDNELIIAGYAFDQLGTPTSIGSSFTVLETQEYVGGQNYGSSLAFIIQTAAAAVNPTWTRGQGTGASSAAIASFKAAAGGGGGTVTTSLIAVPYAFNIALNPIARAIKNLLAYSTVNPALPVVSSILQRRTLHQFGTHVGGRTTRMDS